MYKLIRNTHLLLGLSASAFLLMYGISAVQMAHPRWFSLQPSVTESTLSLAAADPRAAARELMTSHGMTGELAAVQQNGGGFHFRIVRPGTVYEVDYSRAAGSAKVRTSMAGFLGMLNRIHHLAGLRHEYGLLNVWGAFVALTSVVLIGIGLSGIYLWFKIHTERGIGVVLLGGSLAFSLTLIVWMRGL